MLKYLVMQQYLMTQIILYLKIGGQAVDILLGLVVITCGK